LIRMATRGSLLAVPGQGAGGPAARPRLGGRASHLLGVKYFLWNARALHRPSVSMEGTGASGSSGVSPVRSQASASAVWFGRETGRAWRNRVCEAGAAGLVPRYPTRRPKRRRPPRLLKLFEEAKSGDSAPSSGSCACIAGRTSSRPSTSSDQSQGSAIDTPSPAGRTRMALARW
jgi:hypothetical protein